ncbi:ankyrin repeat domain-containing protein [Wolbachia endosymbiont of Ctenocephalides felis wCfeJ]|uniref:ankyrin repeat domain-containing protein n=1 Tax=Wolbachia endosymbiont of Ctenocephalides felis wCfeJ TaxID=2732594 RepID=UPI001446EA26|nr:ankyrin repeat domain-containing protein [Wolbachia endosymbiont of Ctenocephalides felis wCfeJ]WCR57811.1 MAG: hypothetical protein PG980_000283 [Wolbachia endosymbiont of Ctenocephalides felis wCfeJ]
MGIKSNLLVQATKYNNKGIVKFTLSLFKVLDKLSLSVRKKESLHSKENNQHLNDALVFAVENLNYDMVELLVNAGDDVNSLDENNKNAITHAVEKLAASKGLLVNPSKNLPEEISSHPIVQFLLVKGSEYYSTDSMDIEGGHALSIKGNVGHSLQSEPVYEEIPAKNTETQPVYDDRHIYEKVDGFEDDDSLSSGYSSIKELIAQKKSIDPPHKYAQVDFAAKQGVTELDDEHIYEEIDHFRDDEHIYEEIDHFRRDDNSLDSGYSSIERYTTQQKSIYEGISDNKECKNPLYVSAEEYKTLKKSIGSSKQEHTRISDVRERKNPLYVSAEECKTLKKSINSSKQEPIYATVDLAAKRSERKAKSIKADSGTYHGLVKDRKNQWEEKISKYTSKVNTTIGQKEGLQINTRKTVGANVERIRQKYESGYDSDTKMERSRSEPKAPNSKVNSVHVECGIIGNCRKVIDVSI